MEKAGQRKITARDVNRAMQELRPLLDKAPAKIRIHKAILKQAVSVAKVTIADGGFSGK